MPVITMQMLVGRTPVQKRDFIKALSHVAVEVLGVPEDAVRIILTEVPPENWGVGARSMAEIRAAPPTTPR